MKSIAIYGAGGFGKEVATVLGKINEQNPVWNLVGFYDDGVAPETQISRYGKVLGGADALNAVKEPISVAFAIGRPQTLKLILAKIKNQYIDFPNIIHPEVYFADNHTFTIGKGNIIVRGCSFSCDVEVGDFNQFNSISAMAHDVKVGSFNVFMPLTRVSGEVTIGDSNLFGINAIILQTIKVGSNKVLAPNSVLMTKPRREGLYMGNPAKYTKL